MTFYDGYGRIGSPDGLPLWLVVRSFSTVTLKRLGAVGVSPRDATDCNTDAELREVLLELGHRRSAHHARELLKRYHAGKPAERLRELFEPDAGAPGARD